MELENIILCDWIDDVAHYHLPNQYKDALTDLCQKNGHSFQLISRKIDQQNPNIVACIGNKFSSEDLQFMPNLKWIQFGSIGTDKIPEKHARLNKLQVTNARGIFEYSVARHALYLLTDSLFPHRDLDSDFTRAGWETTLPHKLGDISIVLLGSGVISQVLYRILESAGLKVYVVTRQNSESKNNKLIKTIDHGQFNEIECEPVVLINLLPLNVGTNSLIDSSYLEGFQNIISYINVGRPETENLLDILALLNDKKIQFAAWDVIRDFMLVEKIKNQFTDRVRFTPHVASFQENHWPKLYELVFYNLECFFQNNNLEMKNICYG